MVVVGFFGDLHLGNLYSDVDGVVELFERGLGFAESAGGEYVVVFVGDIIEGTNKYRTQIYKMFNVEPLRVQLDYLVWFLSTLFGMARKRRVRLKVYLVLGNHDMGYGYGNIIRFINKKYIRVVPDTLILKVDQYKIVCKHELNRGSRGSYLTWWSGYLLNLGEKLLLEYNADVLVTAHTHRPDISIVNRDDKLFIGLPAYIVSNEDYKYNKAVFYRDGWFRIHMIQKRPRNFVMNTNLRRMSELLGVEPAVETVYV